MPIASIVIQLAAGSVVALLFVAVGQPLFSDDTWWHLSLGRAYFDQGPWLAVDPLAFTTDGPPPPASWLADLVLYSVWKIGGFNALRILQVAIVASTLGLAWSILKRASRNPTVASGLTALLCVISAYRFVQLRPHLFTILATFLIFRLLVEEGGVPSWRRVAASTGLFALWANLHPGYPLGPLLLVGVIFSIASVAAIAGILAEAATRARIVRLAIALVLGVGATLIHPMGGALYAKVLAIGSGGESLAFVVDEWSRFEPWIWPTASVPPSGLTWISIWGLLLATPVLGLFAVRGWRREGNCESIDPARIGLAVAGLVAILGASRFAWMALFPLCLVAGALRPIEGRAVTKGALATMTLLLVPAFLWIGSWPMMTRGLPRTGEGYAMPYAVRKYHAPGVWFMKDAGLEGHLFGRYSEGGFQSFWLGPSIRTAMNGALNMRSDAMRQAFAIGDRRGSEEGVAFARLLDELGIDLFFGTGVPMERRPGRPPNYTTDHLRGVAGWILVFRNVESALYLRANERNQENLRRIETYYASRGVPFDPDSGFDAATVFHRAPEWSRAAGLRTRAMEIALNRQPGTMPRAAVLDRAASGLLALGILREANRANERVLKAAPKHGAALERKLWLLLQARHAGSARELAETVSLLAEHPGRTERTDVMLRAGGQVLLGKVVPERVLRTLPVFSRATGRDALSSMETPEIRWR